MLQSPTTDWMGLVGLKDSKTTCIQGEYLSMATKLAVTTVTLNKEFSGK